MTEDLSWLAEDPFVLPHAHCLFAPDSVFPVDEPRFCRRDLFVRADARFQHAKVLFALTEDLCGLSEDRLSFTEYGCRLSEVLCSPATVLWMLAKDLRQV